MPQRKAHTKSRKGCYQCKQRHIRCSESRPQCENCIRLEIGCTWPALVKTDAPSPSARSESISACTCRLGFINLFTNQLQGSPRPLTFSNELSIQDLSLLHHWTSKTYATVHPERSSQFDIWQTTVVELGLHHHYVLRGILALTAIHKATLHGEELEELLLQSNAYIDQALGEYRVQLSKPSHNSSSPLFAFAIILCLFYLAIPHIKPPTDPIMALLGCMRLVRGVGVVLAPHWLQIMTSPVGPLVANAKRLEHITGKVEEVLRMKQLTDHMTGDNFESDRSACLQAIEELNDVFLQIESCEAEQSPMALIFVWPAVFKEEFMALLADRNPIALIILAHFAVLFRSFQACWWLRGWDNTILDSVKASVGPEYHDWLTWPSHYRVPITIERARN